MSRIVLNRLEGAHTQRCENNLKDISEWSTQVCLIRIHFCSPISDGVSRKLGSEPWSHICNSISNAVDEPSEYEFFSKSLHQRTASSTAPPRYERKRTQQETCPCAWRSAKLWPAGRWTKFQACALWTMLRASLRLRINFPDVDTS